MHHAEWSGVEACRHEREGETERETERETESEREGERERETQAHTHSHTHTCNGTEKQKQGDIQTLSATEAIQVAEPRMTIRPTLTRLLTRFPGLGRTGRDGEGRW